MMDDLEYGSWRDNMAYERGQARAYAEKIALRDWFAGQALVGMLASPELMVVVTSGSILDGTAFDRMANRGYTIADAMLKAREPKETK